ncbi:hypothetical protein LCGC14_2723020, partial [marine sediment metagenome]
MKPLIKRIVVGLLATAITVTGIAVYSDYGTRQSYADYMEDNQNGLNLWLRGWEEFFIDQRYYGNEDVTKTPALDVFLADDDYLQFHVSEIGEQSLLTLARYTTDFGHRVLPTSPSKEKLSYYITYYTMLEDIHRLWSMEIQYARGEISA